MKLEDYAKQIGLWQGWKRSEVFSSEDEAHPVLLQILEFLLTECGQSREVPEDAMESRKLLRSMLNIRQAVELPVHIKNGLDRLLWTERVGRGIVQANSIPSAREAFSYGGRHGDVLTLWQGDITRLAVDATVNAANKELLGCFTPLHGCIDNAIHSAAGPQLREDCATIMARQKHPEATGQAKITRAYNLPARFVVHTVGPIIHGDLSDQHRDDLASCYLACLDLAAEAGEIATMAFCSISTGVYRFPAEQAAPIAVETVSNWLDEHQNIFEKIIFDVFSENDYEHYQQLFTH